MSQTEGPVAARALGARVCWGFLAIACALTAATMAIGSGTVRSFVYAMMAVLAAAVAVYGIKRNDPVRRGAWLLMALGLTLSAAGDVVYDLVVRVFDANPYPYADIFYLAAYPCLAVALWRLAGRHGRDTTADSAIVTLAAAAVVWQLVVTPVLTSADGASMERFVTVLYPVMDVVLVVAIVHAVFLLPRWITAARLLFAGLAVTLVADIIYARLVADGSYEYTGALDALWPISYIILAAAMLHPSMRDLWKVDHTDLVRSGRARIVILATALFCVPALIVVDGAKSDEAIALAAIVAATAALVAWRIARLVTETNRARELIGQREASFRALVQHSSDAIGVIDAEGVTVYVTDSVRAMLGREPREMIGRGVMELVHPDDIERAQEVAIRIAHQPRASEQVEMRLLHSDGSWRWIEATCTNQLDEPAVRGMVGNFRDVTERKLLELAGVGETQVLELILRGAPVAETLRALLGTIEEFLGGDAAATVRVVDPDTQTFTTLAAPNLPLAYVRSIDARAERPAETAAAAHLPNEVTIVHDLVAIDDYPQLRERALAYGLRSFWSFPIRAEDGDAPLGYLAVYSRQPRTPRPAELALLERARDIVSLALDRAAHTEQLGFLALHDTLTELPNRALCVERLDHALESLPTGGPYVAALFLDLDRFKVVNDGFGHDIGDELLVGVGRRLSRSVRRNDTVARFGGDEFVIVCEDVQHEQEAVELAERILASLTEPISLGRAEVVVSASIGIALTDRPSDRAANLLRDADAAMYRAKSRGGGRYELFDQDMYTQAVTRLLTERALRQSLERDELRVLYQPQFDLVTNERICVEALLRWEHPVRGLIAPRDFMGVAEETGLIVPIGDWVLDEVGQHLRFARLHGVLEQPSAVSVNVSARQLLQSDFAARVEKSLAAHDLEPTALCVEVAERVLLDDQEAIHDALRALKDLGVRLAIDDFGTGGSSLTYLRRYPFDEMKIDGTFVTALGRSAADDAIVAATIDMAHALGMVVAAEGIETEAQRSRLVQLGCERGQGYHLGAPEAGDVRHLRLVQQRPA